MISIRWRLTLLLCLAMGALLVATSAGVFFGMRQLLLRGFDDTLTAKARALITASEIDDKKFEIDLIVHEFAGFGAGGSDYFEIRRLDGSLFMSSPSLAHDMPDSPGIGTVKPPGDDTPRLRNGKLGDGRLARFYISRLYPKGDKKGRHQDLYLVVASPTAALNRQLMLLGSVLAITSGAALLLMVPVIRFSLHRGLRPLGRLTGDLARICPENLHERLATGQLPPELQPVAATLNDWLGRLEASFERERRFSSHAAHELRTPLAELKSMAELGARWPEEATPEHLANMVTVASQLASLLEKLSLLGRADGGRLPVALEPVSLAGTLAAALARVEAKAAARGIRLTSRVAEVELVTDPVLWNAIAQNLLDNAVSHSPAGAEVVIEATPQRLAVSNPAPDLAAADLPFLFDHFWRKDEARGDSPHSGLGLSIVRACVQLLGWHCAADLAPDQRFTVTIDWAGAVAANRNPFGVSPR
jgi:signal transduction histidine kinase